MFLWTGRTLFWQPQVFLLTKVRRIVAQCPKVLISFHNIGLLRNFRIDSESSVLTAGPKKFSTQSHNFFVECRKCLYFVYLNFSSKRFDGHVRYCFDNPAEIFYKGRNFFAHCPEKWKTVFIWKTSLLGSIPMYMQDAGLTCPPK